MADIVWDESALNKMLRSPSGMVGKWLDRKGKNLVALAKEQVGVDTGALRSSITHRTTGESFGVQTTVSAWDGKAMMHHEGTRPHRILPVRANVLRFEINGRVIYARQVSHPGTQPNRFLADNLPRVL